MTETETIDTVSVPANIEGDYAINMRGDGMAPAIVDGDLLVVRKFDTQEQAKDGQVVIALVNDEATARRYSKDGTKVHLRADNPTVEDIEAPVADVTLLGRVVGLYRDLNQEAHRG